MAPRLGCDMKIQPVVDFFFGEAAFPRPSDPEGVNQSEKVVERRIAPGGTRHTMIQGLHSRALHAPFGVRPDGRNLFRRAEFVRQDGSGPGGWHSASDFLWAGGKGVGHTMDQKVAEW